MRHADPHSLENLNKWKMHYHALGYKDAIHKC